MPEKLTELHLMFAIEAVKFNVFPLDDRMVERIDPAVSGRPALVKGNSQMLFPGMGRIPEAAVVSMKNVSFSITAELTIGDRIAEGVIIAQGGRFGGWSLYAKDGKASFVYNYFGLESYRIQAERLLPAGTHQVRAELPTTAAAWARAAGSPCITTVRRWARVALSTPTVGVSPRKPRTSVMKAALRYHRLSGAQRALHGQDSLGAT
jgi:hypothetical protein